MTGTAWALARVFGRLTTVFHIDRLTVERFAGIVRPFKPRSSSSRSPAKDAGLHELALIWDSGETG